MLQQIIPEMIVTKFIRRDLPNNESQTEGGLANQSVTNMPNKGREMGEKQGEVKEEVIQCRTGQRRENEMEAGERER
jgi:hypothetical protein